MRGSGLAARFVGLGQGLRHRDSEGIAPNRIRGAQYFRDLFVHYADEYA